MGLWNVDSKSAEAGFTARAAAVDAFLLLRGRGTRASTREDVRTD